MAERIKEKMQRKKKGRMMKRWDKQENRREGSVVGMRKEEKKGEGRADSSW